LSSNYSAAVEELLTNRVDSFEKLEIVVALHAAPRATLTMGDMCRDLKLPRDTVRQAVGELRVASLVDVTPTGDVRLLPPTSRDHAAVTELVALYEGDRLAVVTKLSEIALARIRNMASRAFADAFVIRKKPKDEEDG
jgi:DNA-binding GntR family transcriptional regulator